MNPLVQYPLLNHQFYLDLSQELFLNTLKNNYSDNINIHSGKKTDKIILIINNLQDNLSFSYLLILLPYVYQLTTYHLGILHIPVF